MKPYPCQMVRAVAVIVERIADTAFRATLPNGKTAVAFVEKKERFPEGSAQTGRPGEGDDLPGGF